MPLVGRNKRLYYEYLAKQIEREDSLVNTRITWMLTSQGFLFAALALIVNKDARAELYKILVFILPLTGASLSLIGLFGVYAANSALRKLKAKWPDIEDDKFVRPFGGKTASFIGNIPCYSLPVTMCIIWLFILYMTISRITVFVIQ